MKDVEIIGMIKSYVKKTLVGMGALKGAPCQVQGTVDEGDGTQTLTLEWKDTDGVTHTTDISLPADIFAIVNPSNGQTLRYNSVSGKFENSNVSFSADLEDLDDVVITSVQNGQVLTYDAANNRWINADGSTVGDLSDLDDVVITTAQNGQLLSYNGTTHKWVNISLNIDDLGKVSITSATDGQVLTYDAANDRWINANLPEITVDSALDTTSENPVQNKVIALTLDQLSASKIGYDGTASGLAANKVQGAIDELASEKVDKETGKGLSTNDFTDALKNKLDGIEDNAEVNDIDTIKVNGTALTPDANKAVNIELAMDKLSDVDLNGLADEQILIYDATAQKWISGANTGATYTAGEGIEIDQNNVISSKIVLFTGTEAQWNALPLADKIKFTHYATNDDQTGQIDPVPTQNSANLMTSGGIWSAIQDFISKVTGATANNFAALDASGNVIDSGKKAADFATPTDIQNVYKDNGVLGAKNLIYVEDFTLIKSSARTKSLTTEDFGNDIPKTQVTLSFEVSDSNLTANGEFRAYAPLVSGVREFLGGVPYMADGTYSFSFDATKFDQLYIFINNEDETTATCKISNVMLRFANDSDATYQPYAKTNKELTEDSVDWDNFSNLGAVNFFDNTAPDKSQNGAVYTLNADKSETISAATYPTTVSANASTYCTVTLPKGTYRLSGCPSGGSDSTYRLSLTGIATNAIFDYGDGVVFTISEEKTGTIYFDARANWVITEPVTFYPMITSVSYKGAYVPYAMTNQQLTERMSAPKAFIPTGSAVDSYTANRCRYAQLGAYTLIQFHLTLKSTATSGTAADIIKASDIGLNSWGYTQFALGYGTNSSTVRIVANENTNRIQLESNVGTFPAGNPVYGQMLIYGE